MKIILIQSITKNLRPVFPLGLARIAAVLKPRHDLWTIDLNLEASPFQTLGAALTRFQPEWVGISLRNIDSVDYVGRDFFYPDFAKLLQYIKAKLPSTTIAVGGSGFSLFAEEIMQRQPEIDYGVFLEAEETVPVLLENIDNPRTVKGVYGRNQGEIWFTGCRAPVDFANLPMPAYECFDMQRYVSRAIGIGIEGKRGCCLNCSYCPYPFLNGSQIRMRDPKSVVGEIEHLVSLYDIRQFNFVDAVFNIPLWHARKICQEIIDRKLAIRWSAWTNERMFSEEYARLALEAGCVGFPFSTDAFDDTSLKLMNKNYNRSDILNIVEISKKIADINIGFSFFLNPPGATVGKMFQVFWFLIKSKWVLGKKLRRVFMINRIRIERHTQMHQLAIKEGLVQPESSLLEPVYYTQKHMRPLEIAYCILVWPLDWLMRMRRLAKRLYRRLRMFNCVRRTNARS